MVHNRQIGWATVLVLTIAMSGVSHAQMSARIFGVVSDPEGNPVDGATVTITFEGGLTRSFESTTNDEGEFIQIGLQRGPYSVLVSKDGVGAITGTVTLQAGQSFEMDMQLLAPDEVVRDGLTEEELELVERAETATGAFDAGLAAFEAGNLDDAIEQFTIALEASPDCADCHRNLGVIHTERENYDEAEAAFRQALVMDPEDAESYDGLADVYNATRRFDEAAEAAAQSARLSGSSAGGDNPIAVFDQGLILWNAGRTDEARTQFERTLELDPNHGEAHYWLGMANLNGGQVPEAVEELRLYLEREPDGRFADQASGILSQLAP